MVIQIVPKEEEKKPLSLTDILFYFSLILLFVSVASYFVLNNLQQKAEKNIQSSEKGLTEEKTPENLALEKEVSGYQEKINIFSSLLNNYDYSSQVFPFIESITHPQIMFLKFSADINKKSIKLSGTTDSFQTLGQQLIIFKNEKLIQSVGLSDISFGKDGKILFEFDLTLDPLVFKKNE